MKGRGGFSRNHDGYLFTALDSRVGEGEKTKSASAFAHLPAGLQVTNQQQEEHTNVTRGGRFLPQQGYRLHRVTFLTMVTRVAELAPPPWRASRNPGHERKGLLARSHRLASTYIGYRIKGQVQSRSHLVVPRLGRAGKKCNHV
ncbi:hypothetical protein C7M84_009277 [Penaeus vannamei]|uniref:Uncharacterized protein n=1 Tax=Penaeus vannamei TaxID=6689 RepID=A0A423T7B3_PENVA|nr:hypothetical protein C7M84_009277 [Penaeus vannamei]